MGIEQVYSIRGTELVREASKADIVKDHWKRAKVTLNVPNLVRAKDSSRCCPCASFENLDATKINTSDSWILASISVHRSFAKVLSMEYTHAATPNSFKRLARFLTISSFGIG